MGWEAGKSKEAKDGDGEGIEYRKRGSTRDLDSSFCLN